MPVETRRRNQRWTATDRGMLVLVKLVMDDGWTPATAAAELVRRIQRPEILERMSVRVRAAQSERPSDFGRRAESTISHAQSHIQAA